MFRTLPQRLRTRLAAAKRPTWDAPAHWHADHPVRSTPDVTRSLPRLNGMV